MLLDLPSAAQALQYLGYVSGVDFMASEQPNGDINVLWLVPGQEPEPDAVLAAALPAAKAQRIAAINADCRARLLARYGPAEEQVSRSIGVYGAQEQADMAAGIAATIDASNTAANAVLAAADIAAVEAVSVSWPAI